MRKLNTIVGVAALLFASPCYSADLPKRSEAPVVAAASAYSWSGFYVGIDAGYARSGDQVVRGTGLTALDQAVINAGGLGAVGFSSTGATVGGGFGYNYQFGPGNGIVFGLETDAQFMDLNRRRTRVFDFAGTSFQVTGRQDLDFLGTLRGRIGYAFDTVLLYGTGGFAYGDVNYGVRADTSLFGGVPFDRSQFGGLETGYVYGGGLEFAVPTNNFFNLFAAQAMTLKIEYLRYDLGVRTLTQVGAGPVFGPGGPLFLGATARSRFETSGEIFRAGINYKFGTY